MKAGSFAIPSSSANWLAAISGKDQKSSFIFRRFPRHIQAENEEVMQFIENYRLMGKGLGYVDMHLLASALLTKVPLWTLDQKLHKVAVKLGLAP